MLLGIMKNLFVKLCSVDAMCVRYGSYHTRIPFAPGRKNFLSHYPPRVALVSAEQNYSESVERSRVSRCRGANVTPNVHPHLTCRCVIFPVCSSAKRYTKLFWALCLLLRSRYWAYGSTQDIAFRDSAQSYR
jgi:hypothetical protein